ncbi:MAG TPA: NTP transferase domain-containing protein [Acidimicrobiales bacterium]|nr:NTP transferase domain-containing protein [Acidimicrobiales bacterium]
MTPGTPADAPVLVMLAAGMAKRYGGCKPLAPVGLHGEAVIDLNASDAASAGFGEIVVVVGPQTGPAITYHIERTWPVTVRVSLAEQSIPLGTAHAALSARKFVGDRPFALVNADDIYGVPALRILVDHLRGATTHANVAYRLSDTIVTADPVTRGTLQADDAGNLSRMDERKLVTRHEDGTFTAGDGREPASLEPGTLVSVNLWGFRPGIWPVLEAAVTEVHPTVQPDGSLQGEPASDDEVLLPEVVGSMVAGRPAGGGDVQTVAVLHGPGRCIGITHADDLPVVRTELAVMVGRGERPEALWESVA